MSAYPPTSHSDLLDAPHLMTSSPRPLVSSSNSYSGLSTTTSAASAYPLTYSVPSSTSGASSQLQQQAYAPASYPSYPQHQAPHQQAPSSVYPQHSSAVHPPPGSSRSHWDFGAGFDASHGATPVDASDVYYSRIEPPIPAQFQQVTRTSAGS